MEVKKVSTVVHLDYLALWKSCRLLSATHMYSQRCSVQHASYKSSLLRPFVTVLVATASLIRKKCLNLNIIQNSVVVQPSDSSDITLFSPGS
jgi:hypothetical protein